MENKIKFKTVGVLLTKIIKSIPYPHWIDDIDLTIGDDRVVFTWDGIKYLACVDGWVYEIIGSIAEKTHASIFLQQLLQSPIDIEPDYIKSEIIKPTYNKYQDLGTKNS